MIWSKIKKAINSTLGTKDFKPLDKIVEDSFSEVVEKQNEIKSALETGENDFIAGFVKNGANIVTGVYTGTGTYGYNNPNSLTFPFEPQIVIIGSARRSIQEMILINGRPVGGFRDIESENNKVTWSGKSVSWYNRDNSIYQLNEDRYYEDGQFIAHQYYYVAIGKMKR